MFKRQDPFFFEDQLNEDERLVRDSAREYAQNKLMPRVLEMHRNETFDRDIFFEKGELGFFGATIPEDYGGAGLINVGFGLVAR